MVNQPRPIPLLVNFNEIPGELQALSQWVLWRYVWVEDKTKWDKPPYQPNGILASTTDDSTWCTFQAVKEAYDHGLILPVDDPLHFDGPGFVPRKNEKAELQIVFGDLDKCRDKETGNITPDSLADLKLINSYCEPSPSGTGLRFVARGAPPFPSGKNGRKKDGIELYQSGHYLTITGQRLPDSPGTIETRPDELNEFYKNHYEKVDTELPAPFDSMEKIAKMRAMKLSDDNIIKIASEVKNAQKFNSLFAGNTCGYKSDSEADQALAFLLAFYTDDEAQILRIISLSGLWDEKWERQNYQKSTIGNALQMVTEKYKGNGSATAAKGETSIPEMSEEDFNAFKLPDGPKFECNLPKDNFLQRFMGYGYDVSDAYPDYWFAGGVFALGVVADKKIKVNLRQMTVYANLYIALLGKSSLARKSTAIDKVEAMLDEIWPFLVDAKVPTEFSPEAFIEHMDAYNHAPWIRDEAAGVLSLMKKDYMRGFKDSLLSLFDCKPFHRKLRTSQRKGAKTDFKVDDPYLNMLWATTGASFGANTELIDTLSGFLARFLFFFPQGQKARWLPLEKGSALNSDLSDVVRNQLISIANKMVDIKSPIDMDISPEANAFWANWQKVQEDKWTASNDDFNAQIFSRMNPVVVKLSMLFELGSPDFDPARSKPIRLEFLQEACRLVDTYLMPTSRAVYDLVGSNIEKNVIDRITAYLKNHGGKSTAKEIMMDVKIKKADFDDYLDTMLDGEDG